MVNFFRRSKKVSDFKFQNQIDSKLDELIKRIDCLQESDARLRQDLREIVRTEMMRVLNNRNKRGLWQIA